jgi:hypothetical protein
MAAATAYPRKSAYKEKGLFWSAVLEASDHRMGLWQHSQSCQECVAEQKAAHLKAIT